jgi:hypothetical protein
MENEKKTTKIRNWISRNSETIVISAVTSVLLGTYIALAVKSGKDYQAASETWKESLKERNDLITDAIEAGKTILPNEDGSFWILDLTAKN